MGLVNVKFFGTAIEAANRRTGVDVDANDLRELLVRLTENLGDSFKQRILDSTGGPQPFVNIFVNDKDVRHLAGLETKLSDGDEILILPAIAGG